MKVFVIPTPFIVIPTWGIEEGKLHEYQQFYSRLVEIIKANEPQPIAFLVKSTNPHSKTGLHRLGLVIILIIQIPRLPGILTFRRRPRLLEGSIVSVEKEDRTMSKVYLHMPGWPDKLLGSVKENGDVYRSDAGLDDRIGSVDLETGKVYRRRMGPDEYVGNVDRQTGKVHRQVPLGADDYLGRVDESGRMYRQKSLAPDDYIGKIIDPLSHIHSGAAFLLLVYPASETKENEGKEEGN